MDDAVPRPHTERRDAGRPGVDRVDVLPIAHDAWHFSRFGAR